MNSTIFTQLTVIIYFSAFVLAVTFLMRSRAIYRSPVSCSLHLPPVLILFVFMLAGLSGCGLYGAYSGYAIKPLKVESEKSTLEQLRGAVLKSTDSKTGIVDDDCLNGSTNPSKCLAQRNLAIATLTSTSDELCKDHLVSIYGNEAGFNITTGTIATLTSGAAAITGSVASKSALSAISTFANGERALVNEAVYKNMAAWAVSKKIEEMRDRKRGALLNAMNKPYSEFTLDTALMSIMDYHQTCSFYLGLQRALEEGVNTNKELQKAKLIAEQEALANQIQTYAELRGLKDALKNDPENIKDPLMKNMLDRFTAIKTEIAVLTTATLAPSESADPDTKRRTTLAQVEAQTEDITKTLLNSPIASALYDKKSPSVSAAFNQLFGEIIREKYVNTSKACLNYLYANVVTNKIKTLDELKLKRQAISSARTFEASTIDEQIKKARKDVDGALASIETDLTLHRLYVSQYLEDINGNVEALNKDTSITNFLNNIAGATERISAKNSLLGKGKDLALELRTTLNCP